MPKTPTVESIGAGEAPKSQQSVETHGATRKELPTLAWQVATPQSSGGNVPVISLESRVL